MLSNNDRCFTGRRGKKNETRIVGGGGDGTVVVFSVYRVFAVFGRKPRRCRQCLRAAAAETPTGRATAAVSSAVAPEAGCIILSPSRRRRRCYCCCFKRVLYTAIAGHQREG